MNTIKNETDSYLYVVSHNNDKVWHYNKLNPGQVVTSGQPFQVQFDAQEEAMNIIPKEHRSIFI